MKPHLLALLITAALAGCASGPDYVRPTATLSATLPAAFKEQWKPAGSPATLNPTWWKAFADPTLDQLVDQVDIGNQNLKAAEARYRAALASVQQAGAARLPQVTGKAAASAGKSDSYELSAAASWELDLWGQIRRQVEAAEATARAGADDLAAARLSTRALLAQTYVQLRAADLQADLVRRSVAEYGRFLQLTRNRQSAGLASPLDVAQAETQQANAEAQLLDLMNQRAQLEHAVAVLVGKAPSELTLAPASALPTQPALPDLVPSALLESRPDIAAAERRMAAANAGIGVAQTAYFPTITLGAGLGYKGASLAGLLTSPNYFWSLGPALAATLFDGGAREAGVKQARAGYDQAVAEYRQSVLTAFQEVEDNLAATRLLQQESEAQARALAAARRAREIAENRYKAGVASALEVISAQTAELSADANSVSLASRRLQAAVLLLKNTGGGAAQ